MFVDQNFAFESVSRGVGAAKMQMSHHHSMCILLINSNDDYARLP